MAWIIAIDGASFFGTLSGMRDSIRSLLLCSVSAASLALAACGSSNALTTGSLFGGDKDAKAVQAAAPKPVTPMDRAVYVAANAARAQRCGFYFDPEQVKQSYLAAEAQLGTPADQILKVTKDYDTTRGAVAAAIAGDEGYCTESRTREVKNVLTRNLAGDYNPPQKREIAKTGGLFDPPIARKDDQLDGNAVFDKSIKRQQ